MIQKKRSFILSISMSLLIAFLFFACATAPTEASWFYDYEEAQETASNTNKNILLFFTGSDWDEISQALSADVFTSKPFLSKIASQYILVQLDFPEDESLIDEEQFYKNYDIANRFSLEGIPSAVLTTKEGYIIGSYSGIQEAGNYVKEIQKSQKKSKTIILTSKKLETSEGLKKAKLIDTYLDQLDADFTYLHTDLITQISELDPENQTKLHDKYLLQMVYPKAMDALYTGDYEGAIQMLIDVAKNPKISKKDSQEAFYTAAYLNTQMGLDNETTLEYLQLAYDADPKSEIAQNVEQIITMIRLEMEEDQNLSLPEAYEFEEDAY